MQNDQKISPYLWFDTQAEQAAQLYVDVFNGRPGGVEVESRVLEVTRSPADAARVAAGRGGGARCRRRPGARGHVRARGRSVRRPERWPGVHVQRVGVVLRPMRLAGRG